MARLSSVRYRASRLAVQTGTIAFLAAGNQYGLEVLRGNLSTSTLFGAVVLADPYAVVQTVATGVAPPAKLLWAALAVLLFFSLVAGRAFCSWVCPVNVLADAAAWARRRAGWFAGVRIPRTARYWACGLGIVLSALTGVAAFEWISPIAMLHRGLIFGMGLGWLLVAAVIVFDLAVVERGFCGHLCPLGAFYAVTTRWRALRVVHDRGRCSRCMRCIELCPEPQVLPMVGERSGPVRSGACTNCGRCIEVCPDRAMAFTFGKASAHPSSRKEVVS